VILVPDFVCESLLQPIEDLGLLADFYTLDSILQPEWEALEKKAPHADALVMVHYFGQPQDTERFRHLADSSGVLLVEDNAHGWGGRVEEQQLGTFGDIAVSSPRKLLGTVNGAFLLCARPLEESAFRLPLQPAQADLGGLDTRPIARLLRAFGMARLAPAPTASQQIRERRLPDWAMDTATRSHIESQDVEALRCARRGVYDVWAEWSRHTGLNPVFPQLATGAAPLAFPAWAASRRDARRWLHWGTEHGVETFSWPTLPRAVCRRGDRAEDMWSRLVCFPIHQHIDAVELSDHLAKTNPVAQVRRGWYRSSAGRGTP
jgi:hypothetical protein